MSMSVLGSLAGMATTGIDLFVGGQLTKAMLMVDQSDDRSGMLGEFLEFQFNPETIKINRAQSRTSTPVMGTQDRQQDQNAAPQNESTIQLSNIIFDTYENKPFDSVYVKYIKMLEDFVGYDPHKHAPPNLIFTWGRFTGDLSADAALKCKLDNLDVEYTMFLNDGTPVRAKVNMTLRLGLTHEEQADSKSMKSPDHAKLVTVKRGETLSDIAAVEYDNPGEWRRIAAANEIDDPMSIAPGTKLIVPPILS
jgi:hypothetical protein